MRNHLFLVIAMLAMVACGAYESVQAACDAIVKTASVLEPDPELTGAALTTQTNLSSAAYAVTGAKTLYTACRLGMWLSIFAGVIGLLIMGLKVVVAACSSALL